MLGSGAEMSNSFYMAHYLYGNLPRQIFESEACSVVIIKRKKSVADLHGSWGFWEFTEIHV